MDLAPFLDVVAGSHNTLSGMENDLSGFLEGTIMISTDEV